MGALGGGEYQGTVQKCLTRRVLSRCPITFEQNRSKNIEKHPRTQIDRFSAVSTKNSEKSNRKKILPTSWRSQTPSKTPSTHPPDQAKHNKPSLDANGRLEVIFYDVLCIDQAKNRRWRLNYSRLPPDCPIGSRSGKSAQPISQNVKLSTVFIQLHLCIVHT